MIDLHTHFLPNIDDGSRSIEESVSMLEDSFVQNVTHVVATPHCRVHDAESIADFLRNRNEAYERLKQSELFKNIKKPNILKGAEVYLDNDIKCHNDIEKLCIEGTNYILVEFPHYVLNQECVERLYNLKTVGLEPILAHIDRYDYSEMIQYEVMKLDIVFQFNASSFLSFGGRRLIGKYLEYNKRFVVSSDMHNIGKRANKMGEAYKKALSKYPSYADALFSENAFGMLNL